MDTKCFPKCSQLQCNPNFKRNFYLFQQVSYLSNMTVKILQNESHQISIISFLPVCMCVHVYEFSTQKRDRFSFRINFLPDKQHNMKKNKRSQLEEKKKFYLSLFSLFFSNLFFFVLYILLLLLHSNIPVKARKKEEKRYGMEEMRGS